ncbi:unnamed protein product [Albugo candida]|uniref:Uncharacterized protein n=1 Tax=Albugo candida TaxID=65357 RepID=A0A024GHE6_9STRA|nr:unnamed protein product [Albugo candida]|eukprot:CCI46130.1 unnamed protein product [Albugo candida]
MSLISERLCKKPQTCDAIRNKIRQCFSYYNWISQSTAVFIRISARDIVELLPIDFTRFFWIGFFDNMKCCTQSSILHLHDPLDPIVCIVKGRLAAFGVRIRGHLHQGSAAFERIEVVEEAVAKSHGRFYHDRVQVQSQERPSAEQQPSLSLPIS